MRCFYVWHGKTPICTLMIRLAGRKSTTSTRWDELIIFVYLQSYGVDNHPVCFLHLPSSHFLQAAVWDPRGGGWMGGLESWGSSRETEAAGKEGNEMNRSIKDSHCMSSRYHQINMTLFLSQDPEPLHKSLVKKLVEELTIKKLSEPQIVEKKWWLLFFAILHVCHTVWKINHNAFILY